jgi:hypothetical protein
LVVYSGLETRISTQVRYAVTGVEMCLMLEISLANRAAAGEELRARER